MTEAARTLEDESRMLTFRREPLRCYRLVACSEGREVGYAQLHLASDTSLEVVNLHVEPEHRGKSFGRAILREVLQFARESGVSLISAHTSPENGPAYHLFREMGFRPTEEELHLELHL